MEKERHLKTKDYELHFIEWGPETGPPILALHGWLENAASFKRLAEYLPGHHIVALDFPGHGYSSHLGPGCYHYVDWLPVVSQFAQAMQWDEYTIMGHSMGAGIASLTAALQPEKIGRIVLLEGLAPLTTEADEMPDRVRLYLKKFNSLGYKTAKVHTNLQSCIDSRRKVGRISEEGARCLVERGTKQVEGGYTWRTDPLLTLPSPMRFTRAQVEAFLVKIECPSLVVVANEGFLPTRKYFQELSQLIKNVKIEEVEGGHHVHLDRPDIVAERIKSFLPS